METYEDLYAYLPYFEKRAAESYVNHGSCSDEMNAFIASIEDVDFVDVHYNETLDKYDIPDHDALKRAIPQADPLLLRAAFTHMMRAERFSEGAWGEYEKQGMFLAALKRLGELFGYPPPQK